MASTLTEQCIDSLREEILSGTLKTDEGLVTEKALCERLGVSRVTIRRCLAHLREENLLRSIPYKGYVLGPAAIARRNGSTSKASTTGNRILFVRSPEARPSTAHEQLIWQAACDEAAKFGLEMELCRQPLSGILREIERRGDEFRGIAMEWYEADVVERLLAAGIPAVMVEYLREGMAVDAVYQDNEGGMGQAVERLWSKGHRRIGLVVWAANAFQPMARRAAFASALLRLGEVEDGRVGMSQRFDAEGGREAARALLEQAEPPTAFVVSHLEMAAGVFDELGDKGLKPGKDVAIVAWGTPETQALSLAGTRWTGLELDLIEWSREELGRAVVRVVEARARDPMLPPLRVEIPARLVLRGSS